MYIRGKHGSQYAVFNYNNYIEIRIKEIDKFHYSVVLNIVQIAI